MARNARRLLASRLRELRETAFDVKVTQDQLAEALGEDKPLSSAAISTWENGQTDKRPSESRIVQYALIFSTPHSLHPTPHTPVESKLDNAARTRYENLRDELLELREGAEREAKRERADPTPSDANELWHHPRTEKLFVVVPELPPDQWAPFVRESNVNYVRLARYGDLDAFFEMFTALTRMGYRNLSHRSADEPGIGTARNLVLLGGPAWNGLTRTFLHLLDIPIKQLMEPPGRPDYFTASDGTEVLPTVIEVGDGQSQVIEDVGLFVRTTNPTNPGTDITICSGVYTAGVLGAVRSFTTQHVANENVAAISDRLGQATSFAALFRVKVIEGRVPTPRLTTAIVDCVALE
jgi:transcriptional regulator with XRE-family HTH domain